MKSRIRLLASAGLVGGFVVMGGIRSHDDIAAAQKRTPITVTRIFTGPDNQTHAEQIDVKLKPGGTSGELSEMLTVTGLQFRRTPPNYFVDWHPAPQRQYVITLSGRGEIELVGGEKIPRGSAQGIPDAADCPELAPPDHDNCRAYSMHATTG